MAAGGSQGVLRIKGTSPFTLLRTFKAAGMYGPVPVTIDTGGNIYTADYENGSGTAPADLFVFDPTGKIFAQYKTSPVYGPFGMVVASVVLPCGLPRQLRPPPLSKNHRHLSNPGHTECAGVVCSPGLVCWSTGCIATLAR